jgi:Rieske Fe-S protein
MMKSLTIVAFAVMTASSTAFAPASTNTADHSAAVRMSEVPIEIEPPLPVMSQALPFMTRPTFLDGSMAGDVGFDPLGFAKSESDLMNYREAEVKHARLA